jgi:hypothetical protein
MPKTMVLERMQLRISVPSSFLFSSSPSSSSCSPECFTSLHQPLVLKKHNKKNNEGDAICRLHRKLSLSIHIYVHTPHSVRFRARFVFSGTNAIDLGIKNILWRRQCVFSLKWLFRFIAPISMYSKYRARQIDTLNLS